MSTSSSTDSTRNAPAGRSKATSGQQLLADLEARGLIHDSTDRAALVARFDEGPMGVYVGFDPTADSLHAGNL